MWSRLHNREETPFASSVEDLFAFSLCPSLFCVFSSPLLLLSQNTIRLLLVISLRIPWDEEGAPLLLGTDASNPFVFPGFSIHQELANLVHAGLTPYEALCCGTREAARFLGQSDTWGTIAVNKRADVLLLSANPLDDVGALRQLQMVFCNGYIFPRSQLDELLEQRARTVGTLSPPHFLRKTATVLKWLTS